MRFKRAPLFQLAACLAILAFLFGVVAANAAGPDERVTKDPRQVHKTWHFKSFGVGKAKGGQPSFFKDATSSYCESGCCWASADCPGGDVECSESRCDAWCPGDDGGHAGYSCLE